MNVNRTADIVFSCGAPGAGKSHEIKGQLAARAPDRLVIVDPDGEYEGNGFLHESLPDLYRSTAFPKFRTRFRTSHERAAAERQFDFICRMVRWHADPEAGQARPPRVGPLTLVVDELADLIGSSFTQSPASFQWVVRRGRKYGVTLLAASQRPAEISKTLFDLASTVRTGRLNNSASQKVVADALNVTPDAVRALVDHQFIQRNKITGALTSDLPALKALIEKTSRPAGRPAVKRPRGG